MQPGIGGDQVSNARITSNTYAAHRLLIARHRATRHRRVITHTVGPVVDSALQRQWLAAHDERWSHASRDLTTCVCGYVVCSQTGPCAHPVVTPKPIPPALLPHPPDMPPVHVAKPDTNSELPPGWIACPEKFESRGRILHSAGYVERTNREVGAEGQLPWFWYHKDTHRAGFVDTRDLACCAALSIEIYGCNIDGLWRARIDGKSSLPYENQSDCARLALDEHHGIDP